MLRFSLDEVSYNCPAIDHEEIALETLGDHRRIGDSPYSVREILTEKKLKRALNADEFIIRTIKFLMKRFFEKVMEDVIRNEVIFVFPRGYAYIVAAQQSPTSEYYKYDKKHQQGRVMVMLVFSKKGFAIARGRRKHISLTKKFDDMLREELDNGHRYPVIDHIIEKMNSNGI